MDINLNMDKTTFL